jgi:hypothetical protein
MMNVSPPAPLDADAAALREKREAQLAQLQTMLPRVKGQRRRALMRVYREARSILDASEPAPQTAVIATAGAGAVATLVGAQAAQTGPALTNDFTTRDMQPGWDRGAEGGAAARRRRQAQRALGGLALPLGGALALASSP